MLVESKVLITTKGSASFSDGVIGVEDVDMIIFDSVCSVD